MNPSIDHPPLAVGLAQIKPAKADIRANLSKIREAASATAPRVDLLVFPEAVVSGYFLEGGVAESALSAEELASGLGQTDADSPDLVVGFYERWRRRLYNSVAYLTPHDGGWRPVHVHRKMFLPTYGVFQEARFVEPGTELRAFDTRFGRMGMAVCEELWHAIVPTVLALDGAELLVCVSASPARDFRPGAGEAGIVTRWSELARGAAVEHGVYVALSQLVGSEGGKIFPGCSMIVGPDGAEVVRAPFLEEAVVTATLDGSALDRARGGSPLLADLEQMLPHLEVALRRTRTPDRAPNGPQARSELRGTEHGSSVCFPRSDDVRCWRSIRRWWSGCSWRSSGTRSCDAVDSSVWSWGSAVVWTPRSLSIWPVGPWAPRTCTASACPTRPRHRIAWTTQHSCWTPPGPSPTRWRSRPPWTATSTPQTQRYHLSVGATWPRASGRSPSSTNRPGSARCPSGRGTRVSACSDTTPGTPTTRPPSTRMGDLFKTQVWALARHLGVPTEIVEKPASADLIRGVHDEDELGISYHRADPDPATGSSRAIKPRGAGQRTASTMAEVSARLAPPQRHALEARATHGRDALVLCDRGVLPPPGRLLGPTLLTRARRLGISVGRGVRLGGQQDRRGRGAGWQPRREEGGRGIDARTADAPESGSGSVHGVVVRGQLLQLEGAEHTSLERADASPRWRADARAWDGGQVSVIGSKRA